MNENNQPIPKQKTPRTKNFWLRLIKYLLTITLMSYGIYYFMSQMELDSLLALNNKRGNMFYIMLRIMSAEAWFWFLFLGGMIPALWGDWNDFRWQSFPKKTQKARID